MHVVLSSQERQDTAAASVVGGGDTVTVLMLQALRWRSTRRVSHNTVASHLDGGVEIDTVQLLPILMEE